MKNKVTYLQVKEGKVYASGEIQPVLNLSDVKSSVMILNLQTIHKEAMEKFNQSFVEVNPNILINWAESLWLETPNTAGKHGKYICDCEDGLYAAPEGMVMEVKLPDCECSECQNNGYTKATHKKRFAVISFEPVEEKVDIFEGEKCTVCGDQANHKVGEEETVGHNMTAYICQRHFEMIFMPYKKLDASKDKEQVPDFENRIVEFMRGITFEYPKHAQYQNGFNDACNTIHNNLREFLKDLQEENKKLREQLEKANDIKNRIVNNGDPLI